MTYPNTLVFVDFPSDDVNAARAFYAEVFNWEIEDRIADTFARIVPGQNQKIDDGSQGPSGNFHMGISNSADMRPRPPSAPQEPTNLNPGGRTVRPWILVSDDDSFERILEAAVRLGGTELWRRSLLDRVRWCQRIVHGPVGQPGHALGAPRRRRSRRRNPRSHR